MDGSIYTSLNTFFVFTTKINKCLKLIHLCFATIFATSACNRVSKNKNLAAIFSTTLYVMKGKEGELILNRRSPLTNNYFEVTL